MSALHTLSRLPSSPAALSDTLAYLAAGSSVLLMQDAVAMAAQPRFAQTLAPYRLYLLSDDLAARGLTVAADFSVTAVDYPGFVTLTLQHDNVQAW
ncbi:sulfurtransferase complex subunit TusB [Ferrimonas balearica]|uniref:sulfurtransferase complex subunit TusB n=1 Tax=Ferrimonas balearica TaxID=44012 RepID=UPI001C9A0052|nr:sulfurtransferase complex subunit TusB [Ferrimonas balearica]MBY5991523.1 sulfurtransferase complex subunit TusB [Ferrimonas balearica]